MIFEKIWNFRFLFLNFQKNRSQKLSMLQEKQRQFLNLHWIPHKVIQSDFQFSSYLFFLQNFSRYFQRYGFSDLWPAMKKEKIKDWKLKIALCQCVPNSMQIQKLFCFSSSIDSYWLLFFWRFKNTFYGRGKYIYIYIYYIYTCIYWVKL